MTTQFRKLICCLVVLAVHIPASADSSPLIIRNVAVVNIEKGKIETDKNVYVDGDRIHSVTDVGAALPDTPAELRVVDGTGKYLIPGLWDMHTHIASDTISRKSVLPVFIAHGVTGIRIMLGDCPAPCAQYDAPIETIRQWQTDIAANSQVGPRLSAASFTVGSAHPDTEKTDPWRPSTPEEARSFVEMEASRGVDMIKVHNLVSRPVYFALAEAAEAHRLDLVGHVPQSVTASEAARAGQKSIEHLFGVLEECAGSSTAERARLRKQMAGDTDTAYQAVKEMARLYDSEQCHSLFTTFVESETWQVPTLVIFNHERAHSWPDNPNNRYIAEPLRTKWKDWQQWELEFFGASPDSSWLRTALARITDEMQAAGVGILAGTDANWWGIYPGSSLHEELELLTRAGLSPAEALRSATLNPAIYFGRADELGTVGAGKYADLVLLDANPLEDIRNTRKIHSVLFSGRVYGRQKLDQLLSQAERFVANENTGIRAKL
ncbi:amidohydrolase family protein [Microbulbifer magnicolonia]|uniref:amidohydrolase family protein n=1 Tax=Microbulbifer magnicolonia TaxID=3109744 RepID=UPI002B40DC74|nr:amidohydrolase family protein [Microbulbifer sp. GG15]